MTINRTKIFFIICIISISLVIIPIISQESILVSFSVNQDPVANISLINNELLTNGSINTINFTLTHSNGLDDLDYVQIYLYKSDYALNYTTLTPDGTTNVVFKWDDYNGNVLNPADVWSIINYNFLASGWDYASPGCSSNCGIDPGTDTSTSGNGPTSFDFSFTFTSSNQTYAGNWYITVKAFYSSTSEQATSNTFPVTVWQSISVIDNQLSIESLQPNQNSTIHAISLTVSSNTNWDLSFKGYNLTDGVNQYPLPTNFLFIALNSQMNNKIGLTEIYSILITNQTPCIENSLTLYVMLSIPSNFNLGSFSVELLSSLGAL